MESVSAVMIQAAAANVLGWVWQQARAQRRFPNWVSYAIFSLAGVLCWYWATYNAEAIVLKDWRVAAFMCGSFIQQARGAAAISKDARVAPDTDSR